MFQMLLAAQAAGMVVDYLGTQQQMELGRIGSQLEQASIETSIENSRLQTEDASLQAMIKLRQNLGTQMAIQAARGTSTSSGTATLFPFESVNNFNADEKMRHFNLLGQEARLRTGIAISKLNQSSAENKGWTEFGRRTLNRFPTTEKELEVWKSAWKGFK